MIIFLLMLMDGRACRKSWKYHAQRWSECNGKTCHLLLLLLAPDGVKELLHGRLFPLQVLQLHLLVLLLGSQAADVLQSLLVKFHICTIQGQGLGKMHLYIIETHLFQLFLSADERLQVCHEISRPDILTSSALRRLVSKNPSGCWRGHPRVHCCWYCCRRYSFVCRRAWFNCVSCGCLFHLLGFLTGVIEIETILKTMQLCKWRQNRPFLL